jgi:hypothetical protein
MNVEGAIQRNIKNIELNIRNGILSRVGEHLLHVVLEK